MSSSSELGLKPDPSFENDEKLFRRVDEQHIQNNRVMGNALEEIREQHPSCSFNREKYSLPEQVLDPSRPEQNRIAYLVAGNLPKPELYPLDPSVPQAQKVLYAFRLIHLPEENNYSHTEAQVTKRGQDATKVGSKSVRRELREALAEKMTVLPKTASSGTA